MLKETVILHLHSSVALWWVTATNVGDKGRGKLEITVSTDPLQINSCTFLLLSMPLKITNTTFHIPVTKSIIKDTEKIEKWDRVGKG